MSSAMNVRSTGRARGSSSIRCAWAATSSADLLTDLKSGYLLGANPRKQFLAQFAGIFIGTIGIFLTLFLLFARFFPVLALNELKTILKSSGENYKNQQH
jgi:hypothetical protein